MSTPPSRPVLTHLLYLHGFRSSPQSFKARRTLEWFARHHPQVHVAIPHLPASPRQAMQQVQELVRTWPKNSMAVMGSSLGGYYATWVAAQYACPAVLLNPAVFPARDLAQYIGEITSWHDPQEKQFFQPEYIGQLQALAIDPSQPLSAPQWALIAQGDEVLDWREMVARYPLARQTVLAGSDHALSDSFELYLPALAQFLCTLGADAGQPVINH